MLRCLAEQFPRGKKILENFEISPGGGRLVQRRRPPPSFFHQPRSGARPPKKWVSALEGLNRYEELYEQVVEARKEDSRKKHAEKYKKYRQDDYESKQNGMKKGQFHSNLLMERN